VPALSAVIGADARPNLWREQSEAACITGRHFIRHLHSSSSPQHFFPDLPFLCPWFESAPGPAVVPGWLPARPSHIVTPFPAIESVGAPQRQRTGVSEHPKSHIPRQQKSSEAICGWKFSFLRDAYSARLHT
jgi:hypothetical protein